jgi:paraquat-inducible protein B
MSKQANPVLIGAFVLGALVLAVVTVMLLAGGQWLQTPRQHVMYFDGAAQGLQEGAPVVFLGVKVGTVKRIHLGLDQKSGVFMVAVTIEVAPAMVETRDQVPVDLRDRATIDKLVGRGLRARLRMQSLLTGQLYVDLDFYPGKPARLIGLAPGQSEIPTIPTTVEELSSKLAGFPVDRFFADVATISDKVKQIIATPEVQGLPARLDTTLSQLESLTKTLDRLVPPFMDQARADLEAMDKALTAAQAALAKIGRTADRLGVAADTVAATATDLGALANPAAALTTNLTQTSQELAATAQTVRSLTDSDSPAVHDLRAALLELTRAARALRGLAETLDQQPEAIIRGKRPGGE